ncbi:hypothetical protein [Priestia megaterium]|uniref:Uncharacterized protein n=1 Tax=Priestia megaterium TaxID=1404 RepID=A0A6M6E5P4_PRIMG|nr:hypothetical protein [Priestia megaterium]QJX80834.1 hypothetical protein FDZ14_32615 [Priestia megaterium]
MKDLKLTITALRGMASVAESQNIDSVSLPTSLVESIADQMETLITIIEENEYEVDRFKDYLAETKGKAKLEKNKLINAHGGNPRGG